MKKIIIATLILFVSSCTENEMVKQFGGTMEIQMQPNEKLINITWKNDQMWVLTHDTLTNKKFFREHSKFGIMQGCVIIK